MTTDCIHRHGDLDGESGHVPVFCSICGHCFCTRCSREWIPAPKIEAHGTVFTSGGWVQTPEDVEWEKLDIDKWPAEGTA